MNPFARSVFSIRMLSVFLLGFSSGLPLVLIGSTLKAWLRYDKMDLTLIGFFGLTGLPYTWKFLWAPLMDRFVPPFLDRRRGWILICQVLLVLGFIAMAAIHPSEQIKLTAVVAVFIAFFSASQDIVIDAYRREVLEEHEIGFGSSMAVNGYRLAMYWAGAGALLVAGFMSWKMAYLTMAASMGVSILFTFLAPKVDAKIKPPKTLKEAVIEPFFEFFKRTGAIEILAFILLYKLADQLAGEMLNPFYVDLGFTPQEIGGVSKTIGLWSTIAGGTLGGLIIIRIGLIRSLWAFGILQAVSVALFSVLAVRGHDIGTLAWVVFAECITSGMGTSAYVGFMASVSNRKFTATQYALFSSLMGVPRIIFGSSTGYLAKHMGYKTFFIFCTVTAIPGLLLLLRAPKWSKPEGAAS